MSETINSIKLAGLRRIFSNPATDISTNINQQSDIQPLISREVAYMPTPGEFYNPLNSDSEVKKPTPILPIDAKEGAIETEFSVE